MFEDKSLKCRDCGVDFEFTAREQEFYAEKGFQNEPGRCPTCRSARKQSGNFGGGRQAKVASAKCIRPFAPSAVAPPKFLSPRVAIVRFIAAIASKNRAVSVNKT
jgi:hypothetical protein